MQGYSSGDSPRRRVISEHDFQNFTSSALQLSQMIEQGKKSQVELSSRIETFATQAQHAPEADIPIAGLPHVPEVSALRQHVMQLDSELVDRDAEIHTLKLQAAHLETAIRQARTDAAGGGVLRERYDAAQRSIKALDGQIHEYHAASGAQLREIACLKEYCRILDDRASLHKVQSKRLFSTDDEAKEAIAELEAECSGLADHVEVLDKGFVHFVSRLTHSLAAGIVHVSDNDMETLSFTTLRVEPGGPVVLETFDEPNSAYVANEFSFHAADSQARVAGTLKLELSSSKGDELVRLTFGTEEDFEKWQSVLRLVDLLPDD
mmetsp:Transcript_48707/g.136248  ORF Transcript_48707/g.136248 Transcript_48707/m.136248 type:complete len:321 (+) Transcript_48707:159-1121(+)